MKHFLIVLTAGLLTLTAVFIVYRPDLLEEVWLWVIGLAGPVIGTIQELIKSAKKWWQDIGTKQNHT